MHNDVFLFVAPPGIYLTVTMAMTSLSIVLTVFVAAAAPRGSKHQTRAALDPRGRHHRHLPHHLHALLQHQLLPVRQGQARGAHPLGQSEAAPAASGAASGSDSAPRAGSWAVEAGEAAPGGGGWRRHHPYLPPPGRNLPHLIHRQP